MHLLLICAVMLFSRVHANEGNQQPYVIGDLMGQLGNQLFIIAATTSLAVDNGAKAIFPSLKASKLYGIPVNYKKIFYNLKVDSPPGKIENHYIEPRFTYDPIPYKPNMLIRGWFQSEKYFKHNKEKILELFAIPEDIRAYLESRYLDIIENPKTVAIHYRTYEWEDPDALVYVKADMDYYRKAIYLFPEDTVFVVFSNKIAWCKENFSTLPRNFIFIENETHYHDFYLMSLCRHNIICNSSFSWWAAYLNPNPNKIVIAPKEWFTERYGCCTKDLIPEEWFLLSR